MTCKELVAFLNDYREQRLPADVAADLEKHLELCPPCRAYLRSYEETIKLGRDAIATADDEACREMPEHLVEAILRLRGSGRED